MIYRLSTPNRVQLQLRMLSEQRRNEKKAKNLFFLLSKKEKFVVVDVLVKQNSGREIAVQMQ